MINKRIGWRSARGLDGDQQEDWMEINIQRDGNQQENRMEITIQRDRDQFYNRNVCYYCTAQQELSDF